MAGSLRRDIWDSLFTHYARPHTKILTLPALGKRETCAVDQHQTLDQIGARDGDEGRDPGALRLSHHVSILEMNGDNYRLAQSRARKTANPHQ